VEDGGEAVKAPAERVGFSVTRDKDAVVVNDGTAVEVNLEVVISGFRRCRRRRRGGRQRRQNRRGARGGRRAFRLSM